MPIDDLLERRQRIGFFQRHAVDQKTRRVAEAEFPGFCHIGGDDGFDLV